MAMSKLNEPWQLGKTLLECNKRLLKEGPSDVTFRISSKGVAKEAVYVKALRGHLLARSPVFEAMFTGELAEDRNGPPITVDDIDAEAFQQLLCFIYTDSVKLTPANVMAVMNASKKYLITKLTQKCVQYIDRNMSAESAPQLLDNSLFFNEKELKEKVLRKIQDEASEVLSSEDFLRISNEALREVLQLELKIEKELEVFEASMRWAEQKCEELKKSVDGIKKREVLGDSLFLIRFPTMSTDDFNESVISHDVLTVDEALQVLRYINAKSNKPTKLPFPTEPRRHLVRTLSQNAAGLTPQIPPNNARARTLRISPPYVQRQMEAHQSTFYSIGRLQCKVSKRILIKRILVHSILSYQNKSRPRVVVTLEQNAQQLCRYVDTPSDTVHSAGFPEHYAINMNDVRVEAGALYLYIEVQVNKWYTAGTIHVSHWHHTQMADDYVTVKFDSIDNNVLYGIEYTPAA